MKHKTQAQSVARSAKTGHFARYSESTPKRGEVYERAKIVIKSIDGAMKRLASK